MTAKINNYERNTAATLESYRKRDAATRNLLFDAVKDREIESVLDIGCGAGQELFPFLEQTKAVCFGVDVAEELGKVTGKVFAGKFAGRIHFVRSKGEKLPFADASFDVVLCLIALPYMNNKSAIAEVSRVLKPNGIYLLKTHAPPFYFEMIRVRTKTLNPKQIAYPLICLAGSVWHSLTGKQPEKGFWRGKEVFQTRNFLEKEFEKNNLKIREILPDSNPQTPSFLVVKR